jgi:hypothetical protein
MGEGTFAGARANGEVAPQAAIHPIEVGPASWTNRGVYRRVP